MSAEAIIAIVSIVLSLFGILIGFSVKLILNRLDKMERDQGERFNSIDRQMERTRTRLHNIENWIAAQVGMEKLHHIFPLGPITRSDDK
jgi:hypothetical protein